MVRNSCGDVVRADHGQEADRTFHIERCGIDFVIPRGQVGVVRKYGRRWVDIDLVGDIPKSLRRIRVKAVDFDRVWVRLEAGRG